MSGHISSTLDRAECWSGMKSLVDFWGGYHCWDNLEVDKKTDLVKHVHSFPEEFRACIKAQPGTQDLEQVNIPTLILCGTKSPQPVKRLSCLLNDKIASAKHRTINEAGHMAPLTHSPAVIEHIGKHLQGYSLTGSVNTELGNNVVNF